MNSFMKHTRVYINNLYAIYVYIYNITVHRINAWHKSDPEVRRISTVSDSTNSPKAQLLDYYIEE